MSVIKPNKVTVLDNVDVFCGHIAVELTAISIEAVQNVILFRCGIGNLRVAKSFEQSPQGLRISYLCVTVRYSIFALRLLIYHTHKIALYLAKFVCLPAFL